MANIICSDCGYRFETGKRCPYCASESIEEEKSAEELVDTVKIE
tara:strand:+ start:263 stop:394 length:132 start_codon:yes stop_codon:yes gene_type:complete